MSQFKKHLNIDVLTAAQERIKKVFDDFPNIYVSFSGGKDSSVMLHLVMEEAIKRNRKVGLFFLDWEAQYSLTIDHVKTCYELYVEHIDPYWVCLPIKTDNAVSQFEPEWTCWEPGKNWVREIPDDAISDYNYFDFYTNPMTFEDFVPEFGYWYAGKEEKLTACFVGIRADESLNRFRTLIMKKTRFEGLQWTTWCGKSVYNAYPIYDWKTADIWTYYGISGKPYNKLYDRMYQAGLSIHQMRICEPYGYEQRKGLWLFHVIEPETWGKIVARVNGANSGALYGKESGNVLGNRIITKPEGHTWESFARFLLDTMPPKTAEHYKNKIAIWMKWYLDHDEEIRDCIHGDTGSQDMPSWRRVCKVLLRHDFWCQGLCFSITKSDSYDKYCELVKGKRMKWRII